MSSVYYPDQEDLTNFTECERYITLRNLFPPVIDRSSNYLLLSGLYARKCTLLRWGFHRTPVGFSPHSGGVAMTFGHPSSFPL